MWIDIGDEGQNVDLSRNVIDTGYLDASKLFEEDLRLLELIVGV